MTHLRTPHFTRRDAGRHHDADWNSDRLVVGYRGRIGRIDRTAAPPAVAAPSRSAAQSKALPAIEDRYEEGERWDGLS